MAKQQTPYRMTALADIKPYDRNPRIIPQAAVDSVARSIQAFGFRQPIVVDGNGVILAGHTRYKAAQQLGMTEVPVVWQTDITDIQARGYRIADNKVAELSAWDRDALDAEVRDLADLGDLDIGAIGLADWELERILREDDSGDRLPDEVPPSSYSASKQITQEKTEPLSGASTPAAYTPVKLNDLVISIAYSENERAELSQLLRIDESKLHKLKTISFDRLKILWGESYGE